jgi:hypothetical protein
MLSVYKLTNAINESASGVSTIESIPAYNFIGGLDEATSEMNYILMSEAVDLMAFQTGASEIMTEAAINNPDSLSALSENVFQTVGAKVKAFIDKIISMVKGIIEKIKAFFFKLTGKIDKWLGVMKPRITKASGFSGAGDQDIEMHQWDVDYIATEGGLASGLGSMADEMTKKANDKFIAVEAIKQEIAAIKSEAMSDDMRDKGGDDPAVKGVVEKLEKGLEKLKDTSGDYADNFRGAIAEALDVTGENPNNMDDVWAAVTKRATGGEKITMKFSQAAGGKGVDGMLKAIEGSKKSISSLKKSYEKHLSDLGKLKSAVEKAYKADSKVEKIDKFPAELRGKYQSFISELSNDATKGISIMESAMNTAKSKHIGYVQQMTSEYMSALSKYANYKGKEKDEV